MLEKALEFFLEKLLEFYVLPPLFLFLYSSFPELRGSYAFLLFKGMAESRMPGEPGGQGQSHQRQVMVARFFHHMAGGFNAPHLYIAFGAMPGVIAELP